MRKLQYIKIIFVMLLLANKIQAQLPKNDALYTSKLNDDFTGSVLDTSKWLPRYPWGQFWQSNKVPSTGWCGDADMAGLDFNAFDTHNRSFTGTTTQLIGRRENVTRETWWWTTCTGSVHCAGWDICHSNVCFNDSAIPFKYTNAAMVSRATFKFGYFEIKFKTSGFTPASSYTTFSPTFWLNGGNAKTPWSEIDIYEIDATKANNNFANNVHIDTSTNASYVWDLPIPGLSSNWPSVNLSNWHTAAINWTPNYIDFYLDSSLVRSLRSDYLKYLVEMYLIIENGVPATNFCHPIDTTNMPFPVTYEIDYIKAYQPLCDCSTNKTYCNVTESTFVSKIYKSLTLGGSGCSATFDNKTVLSAEANDFVLLQEGFQAGTNINMIIDCQPYCSDSIKYTPNFISKTTPLQPQANYKEIYKQSRNAY